MAAIVAGSDLDMQGTARVKNLPSPLVAGDAVNKAYADGLAAGAGSLSKGLSLALRANLPLY